MKGLLRVIPVESTQPVQLVCYHPCAEKHLRRGDLRIEPDCLAVEYAYDKPEIELRRALYKLVEWMEGMDGEAHGPKCAKMRGGKICDCDLHPILLLAHDALRGTTEADALRRAEEVKK
jgi:hypothetical protein